MFWEVALSHLQTGNYGRWGWVRVSLVSPRCLVPVSHCAPRRPLALQVVPARLGLWVFSPCGSLCLWKSCELLPCVLSVWGTPKDYGRCFLQWPWVSSSFAFLQLCISVVCVLLCTTCTLVNSGCLCYFVSLSVPRETRLPPLSLLSGHWRSFPVLLPRCLPFSSGLVAWFFALRISVVRSHLAAFTQLQPSLAHWFFPSLKTSLPFCRMLLGLASSSFQMQFTATQLSSSPHRFYQTPNPPAGWSTYRGYLASVSESGPIPCSCQVENSQVPLHLVRQ